MVQPVHGRNRRAAGPGARQSGVAVPRLERCLDVEPAPLAPLTSQVFHAVSDTEHHYNIVRHLFAGWVQDDWRIGNI